MADQQTPAKTLFIRGVGKMVREYHIRNKFQSAGRITKIKNPGKGYVFLTFETLQEATNCLQQFNGGRSWGLSPLQIEYSAGPKSKDDARAVCYRECLEDENDGKQTCFDFNNEACIQEALSCDYGLHRCLWCFTLTGETKHHARTGDCPNKKPGFVDFKNQRQPRQSNRPSRDSMDSNGEESSSANTARAVAHSSIPQPSPHHQPQPPDAERSKVASSEGVRKGGSSLDQRGDNQMVLNSLPQPSQRQLQPFVLETNQGRSRERMRLEEGDQRGDNPVAYSSIPQTFPHHLPQPPASNEGVRKGGSSRDQRRGSLPAHHPPSQLRQNRSLSRQTDRHTQQHLKTLPGSRHSLKAPTSSPDCLPGGKRPFSGDGDFSLGQNKSNYSLKKCSSADYSTSSSTNVANTSSSSRMSARGFLSLSQTSFSSDISGIHSSSPIGIGGIRSFSKTMKRQNQNTKNEWHDQKTATLRKHLFDLKKFGLKDAVVSSPVIRKNSSMVGGPGGVDGGGGGYGGGGGGYGGGGRGYGGGGGGYGGGGYGGGGGYVDGVGYGECLKGPTDGGFESFEFTTGFGGGLGGVENPDGGFEKLDFTTGFGGGLGGVDDVIRDLSEGYDGKTMW